MNLKKLTFILSLIGVLFLLFLPTTLSPKKINIKDINTPLLNKQIQIQGQIINIKTYKLESQNNLQILEVSDLTNPLEKTEVVLNNPKINLEKNQNIIIIGKITSYKNTLQIQADKIIIP